MEPSKMLTLLTALILAVCLVLSITALISLRHAVEEGTQLRAQVVRLQSELESCIEVWKELPTDTADPPTEDATESEPIYLARANGDQLAIYGRDGALVALFDLNVDTLPAADREALRVGIELHGQKAVQDLLADYTS